MLYGELNGGIPGGGMFGGGRDMKFGGGPLGKCGGGGPPMP